VTTAELLKKEAEALETGLGRLHAGGCVRRNLQNIIARKVDVRTSQSASCKFSYIVFCGDQYLRALRKHFTSNITMIPQSLGVSDLEDLAHGSRKLPTGRVMGPPGGVNLTCAGWVNEESITA
jgi:hypothetical protein